MSYLMKKLVIICLFLSSIACAHHKPAATPEEVNRYLSDMCHIAESKIEMHSKLRDMLINRKVNF